MELICCIIGRVWSLGCNIVRKLRVIVNDSDGSSCFLDLSKGDLLKLCVLSFLVLLVEVFFIEEIR